MTRISCETIDPNTPVEDAVNGKDGCSSSSGNLTNTALTILSINREFRTEYAEAMLSDQLRQSYDLTKK